MVILLNFLIFLCRKKCSAKFLALLCKYLIFVYYCIFNVRLNYFYSTLVFRTIDRGLKNTFGEKIGFFVLNKLLFILCYQILLQNFDDLIGCEHSKFIFNDIFNLILIYNKIQHLFQFQTLMLVYFKFYLIFQFSVTRVRILFYYVS